MKLMLLPGDPGNPRTNCMNSGIPRGTSSEEPGGEIAAASWPMQLAGAAGPFASTGFPPANIASRAMARTKARSQPYLGMLQVTYVIIACPPSTDGQIV